VPVSAFETGVYYVNYQRDLYVSGTEENYFDELPQLKNLAVNGLFLPSEVRYLGRRFFEAENNDLDLQWVVA